MKEKWKKDTTNKSKGKGTIKPVTDKEWNIKLLKKKILKEEKSEKKDEK